MKLAMAVFQTLVATAQWYNAETYSRIVDEYPAARFQRPMGLIPLAWFLTVLAGIGWWRAITHARRRDREEPRK